MNVEKVYPNPSYGKDMLRKRILRILPLLFGLFFTLQTALPQDTEEYYEISVYLEIKGVGTIEIPAVIRDEDVYLPVTELFDYLKIRNVPSEGMDSISGFFINPDAKYYINRITRRIIYQEKLHQLRDDEIVKTETGLYLRTDILGKIFGLDCNFNFRNLLVVLSSRLELPLIREMKLNEMRKNLSRLQGEIKADTSYERLKPGFRAGMADWSVIGSQEINGRSDARIAVNVGSVIAGGETTLGLYYNSAEGFLEKQQNYLWRYVNNDFAPLRQVMVGKIQSQAISSIYNPVVGFQLTNTPTSFRRSFGSYTLSDRTEPDWIVELYVNNVLVDYVKADASGFFTFKVPLVYGNTIVKLKFYGPWGEERTREQVLNIPYNFLPEKTLEYNVSAGFVEDTLFSRFSRAQVNYGLTKSVTVGGGIEYLSSVASGPAIPFLKASARITGNLLLHAEYSYGVRTKGTVTFRLPSDIQFDLNYTLYDKDQKAISVNYLQERKLVASMPLRIKKFNAYNRFAFGNIIVPGSHYTTAEYLFNSTFMGVNTSATTYGIFVGSNKPYFYSNLSLSARLPAKFTLMPQMQYSWTANQVLSGKLKLEKLIGDKTYMSTSFERNFAIGFNMAELAIRHDFSFAKTGLSIRNSGGRTSIVEHASGSIIGDSKTGYTRADNRTNVGRGAISVSLFIDSDGNGQRDPGENRIEDISIRVNTGRIVHSDKDTTVKIFGLEPYTNCFIELDERNFENVSWKLKYKTLSIAVDPNMIRNIEVPVIVAGEANGTVYLDDKGTRKGQRGVILNIVRENGRRLARVITEEDGYYSYLGLLPGKYRIETDTNQLRRLGMKSEPLEREFSITGGFDGDIVDNLDFILSYIKKDTATELPVEQPEVKVIPVVKKDTVKMIVHELVEELVTIDKDQWAIQLGAFRKRSNAEALQRKLKLLFGKNVEIVIADDYFKVRITEIMTRQEVDDKIEVLRKNGITELWLISLKAKTRQILLRERTDTVSRVREVADSIVETRKQAPPVLSVQAGAFRSKSYATALRTRLSSMLNKPVEIVEEDGYYKVRVTGFTNRIDLERILPTLGMMGFKDLWVPTVKLPEDDREPVIVALDTVPEISLVTTDTLDRADFEKADEKVIERIVEDPSLAVVPLVKEPPVMLRVGEFLKYSQAARAQRKIRSRLEVQTELFEQWGYYYVIIKGFYTREETYKFYPELAELGYSKISLVEK